MAHTARRDPSGPSCGLTGPLPRPLAFVLSGGAASGATQVGMLRALREAGVTPDLIVGTSVGAINGVMLAADPSDGADRLAEVWHQIDRAEILGTSSLRCLPRLVRTRRHLFPPDALRDLIRRHLPVPHFESLTVPFAAVATRVACGGATVLRDGWLEPALLATAAIPGIFPRVEIDGQWYFDGGVTANLPIRQALALGARSVVVLNAAPPDTDRDLPTNIAETLHYVTTVLMRNQVSADIDHLRDHHHIVDLPRTSPHGLSPFDFSGTTELIDAAYEEARRFLADLPEPAVADRG